MLPKRQSNIVLSERYETSYLFYATLSFWCNIICYLISVFAFSLVTLSGATSIRMLWAILNKSWRPHPTKQQLYSHLPPIMKTIQVRRTRHVRHCWRCNEELISDVLLWTPSHGQAKAVQPTRTYIQLLCANTGCSLDNRLEVMDSREGWWERVRDIHADGVTWWGWWKIYLVNSKIFQIFTPK